MDQITEKIFQICENQKTLENEDNLRLQFWFQILNYWFDKFIVNYLLEKHKIRLNIAVYSSLYSTVFWFLINHIWAASQIYAAAQILWNRPQM